MIDMNVDSAYDLLRAQEKVALSGNATAGDLIKRDLRMKSIESFAFQMALTQAIKSRLAKTETELSKYARELDGIYDFGPLLIKGQVIPPVITEATDIYNLEDNTTIRTSDKIYQIKNQARFSSVAPNWRAYMPMPIDSKAYSSEIYVSKPLMPQNEAEKQVWVAATVRGWDSGTEQANTMLENNFRRLNRDYIGMVRFHEFVLQGKLTMPIISQYDLDNSNDGNTMVLNEQMLKITQLPQFENKWIRNPDAKGYPDRGMVLRGDEVQVVPPITLDRQNSNVRDIKLKMSGASLVPRERLIEKELSYDRDLSGNTLKSDYIVRPPYKNIEPIERISTNQVIPTAQPIIKAIAPTYTMQTERVEINKDSNRDQGKFLTLMETRSVKIATNNTTD